MGTMWAWRSALEQTLTQSTDVSPSLPLMTKLLDAPPKQLRTMYMPC